MRALLQRVSSAKVSVDGEVTGSIQRGLLVFAGIHKNDQPAAGEWIMRKILALRIFEDEAGKMNRSVVDSQGEILIVSQFTLYGDVRKGTRPSFEESMPGAAAREYYTNWVAAFRAASPLRIQEGRFAAMMKVELVNDGPVTLMLESPESAS